MTQEKTLGRTLKLALWNGKKCEVIAESSDGSVSLRWMVGDVRYEAHGVRESSTRPLPPAVAPEPTPTGILTRSEAKQLLGGQLPAPEGDDAGPRLPVGISSRLLGLLEDGALICRNHQGFYIIVWSSTAENGVVFDRDLSKAVESAVAAAGQEGRHGNIDRK